MPSDLTLDVGSQTGTTVLSTELNSLANGSAAALSSAIDNASNLDRYAWFELNVTFGSNPTADSVCEIYVVYLNTDASNYGDYSTTGPVVDPSTMAAVCVLRAATAAQRRVSGVVLLRARSFKVGLVNRSGQSFPASGSTLKLFTERDAAT